MKPSILIVDDDEELCSQMKWALAEQYRILRAGDRLDAVEQVIREQPDAVLLDLGLPPSPDSVDEGMTTLHEIRGLSSTSRVIVISGHHEKETVLRALDHGASDFLTKPVDPGELEVVVRRACTLAVLERENVARHQPQTGAGLGPLVGTSPAMQAVFKTLRKGAMADAPVLIRGGKGTGKEMAVQALHQLSPRRDQPLVLVRCSAIPADQVGAEIFGGRSGSTRPDEPRERSQLERAEGGILFLDEVCALPPSAQVSLLRLLQHQAGGHGYAPAPDPVDVRVCASTNRDMDAAVREGRFREDLYYRLAVVQIHLPPLRERGDDIRLLAETFLHRHARAYGRAAAHFDASGLAALHAHPWPGNVRELDNRVKRAVILGRGPDVSAADLELDRVANPAEGPNLREARAALERGMIQAALARHQGKVSRAAADLAVSRPTLYDLMVKYDIPRP